jgi:hypothetical protein
MNLYKEIERLEYVHKEQLRLNELEREETAKAQEQIQDLKTENEAYRKLMQITSDALEKFKIENMQFRTALDEIALYGITRPLELGEGDDGDGHFRRIAYSIIKIAAKARQAGKKQCRD